MDVIRFSKILKDTAFPDYKKLQHKYPTDFADFLDAYRQMVLCTLTLSDFNGKPAVYAKDCAPIDKKAVKLLLRPQDRAFGVNAAEEEIASTAAIESIDFNRDSIRSIVKGMVPKDEAETRILGLKGN